jgi:hypothetical protein
MKKPSFMFVVSAMPHVSGRERRGYAIARRGQFVIGMLLLGAPSLMDSAPDRKPIPFEQLIS